MLPNDLFDRILELIPHATKSSDCRNNHLLLADGIGVDRDGQFLLNGQYHYGLADDSQKTRLKKEVRDRLEQIVWMDTQQKHNQGIALLREQLKLPASSTPETP